MVLTRLLLFAGALQALAEPQVADTTRVKLDPALQMRAVRQWLELLRSRPAAFCVADEDFHDPDWWLTEPEAIIACLGQPAPRRFTQLGRVRPGLSLVPQTLRRSRISLPGLK